jgi:hypothetical protein
MNRRRMVLYILLNVLVSALVTGTVLYYFDRSHPKPECATIGTVPTPASAGVNADILSVSGVGALASESVTIQNKGDSALELTGWTLKDSQGSSYVFPQVTLYAGGTVHIHTGTGTDSAADLFWQLAAPVWKSGVLVALYDPQNIARAFYRVP